MAIAIGKRFGASKVKCEKPKTELDTKQARTYFAIEKYPHLSNPEIAQLLYLKYGSKLSEHTVREYRRRRKKELEQKGQIILRAPTKVSPLTQKIRRFIIANPDASNSEISKKLKFQNNKKIIKKITANKSKLRKKGNQIPVIKKPRALPVLTKEQMKLMPIAQKIMKRCYESQKWTVPQALHDELEGELFSVQIIRWLARYNPAKNNLRNYFIWRMRGFTKSFKVASVGKGMGLTQKKTLLLFKLIGAEKEKKLARYCQQNNINLIEAKNLLVNYIQFKQTLGTLNIITENIIAPNDELVGLRN